jgi:hypothetical protein
VKPFRHNLWAELQTEIGPIREPDADIQRAFLIIVVNPVNFLVPDFLVPLAEFDVSLLNASLNLPVFVRRDRYYSVLSARTVCSLAPSVPARRGTAC